LILKQEENTCGRLQVILEQKKVGGYSKAKENK
jgi:hypothetical protein